MATDNEQRTRETRRSIKEMAQKAWGKEWRAPEPGYEFSNGRKFDDGQGVYEDA